MSGDEAKGLGVWKLNYEKHLRLHHPKTLLQSLAWNNSSRIVCALFLCTSKVVGKLMNRTNVHNKNQFLDLLDNRDNRGLLTVSNHTSRLDDPLMWSMLTWRQLLDWRGLRWNTGAEDVCFRHRFSAFCMAVGKILPLHRGSGVYQKSMDFCVDELNSGKWVHIFPEGKINLEQKHMRLKWGVGRLIADAHITPYVLLIHHIGFEHIFPNEGPLFPRIGQKSSICIGKPLDFTQEVLDLRNKFKSQDTKTAGEEIRKHLTDIIQEKMADLKEEAENFHRKVYNVNDLKS